MRSRRAIKSTANVGASGIYPRRVLVPGAAAELAPPVSPAMREADIPRRRFASAACWDCAASSSILEEVGGGGGGGAGAGGVGMTTGGGSGIF